MTIWIDNHGVEYNCIEIERPIYCLWEAKDGTRVKTPYLWPSADAARPTINGWPVEITAQTCLTKPPIRLNFAARVN